MKHFFHQEIYKDKWLLIIGIPFVVLLIQHIGLGWETIKEYIKKDYYFYNIIFNLLVTVIVFLVNKAVILWLDRRLPYRPKFKKRIAIQLLLNLFVLITIIEFLAYLYVKVWAESDYWETHLSTDLPFAVILVVLLNFVYIGFFLQYDSKNKPTEYNVSRKKKSTTPHKIEVSMGNKKVLLEPTEITLFFSQNKITHVLTLEGKRYLHNESLKHIYQLLEKDTFFQANRQIIINKSVIKGYRKLSNRKLELDLAFNGLFEESIFISKEKSPMFLKWLVA